MDDLIEACNEALADINPYSSGIKRRQIFDDIKFMKDSKGYNAPIESFRFGKRAYYRYDNSEFSINSQPLNEQEAQQLKESLLTLSRFKGMPQFDWVEEIRVRLEQKFNLTSDENVISFDENPYLTGRELISDLYNSIVNREVLLIKYKPFKQENEILFELHPYHLKQYNNRWFLFGLNEKDIQISNIALDRIISIDKSKSVYIPNTKIDFVEYFEDVIGVTIDERKLVQKVILEISANLWPYIKTKPLHGSQRILTETKENTIVELELILNFELESIILSYGEEVEVIKPEALRNNILKRCHELNNMYRA